MAKIDPSTNKKSSREKADSVSGSVESCSKCPRLLKHCQKIASEKRRAFLHETYWGRPVPSFGDPQARLFILGLAPAAHGANRTGRMFTGDNSGLWLYRALYRAKFSNQAESTHAKDGLQLKNAWITAVAHCAPPENKLTPVEIKNCSSYLADEIRRFGSAKIYLVLGSVAHNSLLTHLKAMGLWVGKSPKFSHGALHSLAGRRYLLCSYHPSQQNTFTGRLTEEMFDGVFERARELLRSTS